MNGATLTIAGNLTADPELLYTQNGIPVCSFNVADTPRRLNRDTNEWQDAGATLFQRVNVWRDQAENVAASLHKGDAVVVIGSLVARPWTDKDGNERTSVELEARIVSVDLRRQRIERVARVRAGAEPAADAWTPPASTRASAKSAA